MNRYPPQYRKPPLRYRLWEIVRTTHQVIWMMGLFVGIPAAMIPVLGRFPQIRQAIGYCIIWGLAISFIVYLVRSLISGERPPGV